jgi:hypothetical protein
VSRKRQPNCGKCGLAKTLDNKGRLVCRPCGKLYVRKRYLRTHPNAGKSRVYQTGSRKSIETLIAELQKALTDGSLACLSWNPLLEQTNAPRREQLDPYLKLRCAVLLQAIEDLSEYYDDPVHGPEIKSWWFSGTYWDSFRVSAWESDCDGDGVESPLKSLRESYELFFKHDAKDDDGIFSLRCLCEMLGLDFKKVRHYAALSLGDRALGARLVRAAAK